MLSLHAVRLTAKATKHLYAYNPAIVQREHAVQLAKAVHAVPAASHPRVDAAAVVTVPLKAIAMRSQADAEANARPFVLMLANVQAEQLRFAVKLPKQLVRAQAGQPIVGTDSNPQAPLAVMTVPKAAAVPLAAVIVPKVA